MQFTRLQLSNWRNFRSVDAQLRRRMFLVGPNASGKSNFLDAFRFLRDVADPQGGFQQAVHDRDGVKMIRSLHARRPPDVAIEVEVDLGNGPPWSYRLEFGQDPQRRPLVKREVVRTGEEVVLSRPNAADEQDPSLLTQTHLEQVTANRKFRQLQESFASIRYLHVIPQLIREPERSLGLRRDPFGGDFLERLAGTAKKQRESRLRRIVEALRVAVPQLEKLELDRDHRGVPHLRGSYRHWRGQAAWQSEAHLSDGTLRLLGLLWSLLDGDSPLLLEEPELSLHAEVVRQVARMMTRITRKSRRQLLISTHSSELLEDEGIAPEEVLLFEPTKEDTRVRLASVDEEIRALLDGGVPMGEAVLPRTAPPEVEQLSLWGR